MKLHHRRNRTERGRHERRRLAGLSTRTSKVERGRHVDARNGTNDAGPLPTTPSAAPRIQDPNSSVPLRITAALPAHEHRQVDDAITEGGLRHSSPTLTPRTRTGSVQSRRSVVVGTGTHKGIDRVGAVATVGIRGSDGTVIRSQFDCSTEFSEHSHSHEENKHGCINHSSVPSRIR